MRTDMVLDDILETIRRGEAGKREADWLALYLGLGITIKNPSVEKGEKDEQENRAEENDLLCTGCYLGRCVNRV